MESDSRARADSLRAGDRGTLARAITQAESTRPEHRAATTALLDELLRSGVEHAPTFRIGITGTPGVGKSTFIERFGLHLCDDLGLRIAVLAVDPSSSITGGSILGDKTRMARLSRHPRAYIRPSPAGRTLGGVARRTREVMLLCEAAGVDVVLIETVGVGQSETAVANLTDAFLLLIAPAGGDELQGVKRGIMELADVLVVNKCDGALEATARATAADYKSALRLIRTRTNVWTPEVLLASALTGLGADQVWMTLSRYRDLVSAQGDLVKRRAEQRRSWMWDEVADALLARARSLPSTAALEDEVVHGTRSPSAAAAELLNQLSSAGE